MELPKCRLCGHRHLSGEEHIWPDDIAVVKVKTYPKIKVDGCGGCGATVETFEDAEKWRKLRERRREYMRKRRRDE